MNDIIASLATDGDAEPEDVDEAPPSSEIPMTKPGDLWLLGDHRLLCASATDRCAVARLMDGEKAHLVFTDPPYGVSYVSQSGKFEMLENDDLNDDDLVNSLLLPAFRNMVEFTMDDAAFYIWHASTTRRDFYDAMTAAGLINRQDIVWAKRGFVLGHNHYQWAHEVCFYCSKSDGSPRFFGDRAQRTVWRVTRREKGRLETVLSGGVTISDGKGSKIFVADRPLKVKKSRRLRAPEGVSVYLYAPGAESTLWEVSVESCAEHPTQKPVELAERAIRNSSLEGEIVLDLFGGSGSTLIAAETTRRRARLMELNPKYADVSVNRYARITGDVEAVCVRDGKDLPYSRLKRENDAENGR